jgi:putative ABC transport system permease protein
MSVSYPNFLDWERQQASFDAISLHLTTHMALRNAEASDRVAVTCVSSRFFDVLGTQTARGRLFTTQEAADGGPPVAVLTHDAWQRRFNADPGVLSKTLRMDGRGWTVVGVLPAGFRFHAGGEIFVPIHQVARDRAMLFRFNHNGTDGLGRLKPGVSIDQARAEMGTIAARLAEQYPKDNAGVGATAEPLHAQLTGWARPTFRLLVATALVVWLIAVVNVTNLHLVRALQRQREIGLRRALGATDWQLVRVALSENLLLALLGGILGLTLAWVAAGLLDRMIPWALREHLGYRSLLDWRMVGAGLALSLLTGAACGLLPALGFYRVSLQASLREGQASSTTSARRHRLRHTLVATEIAMAVVLVLGAGLMLRSLDAIQRVQPGFQTAQIVTARVSLPPSSVTNLSAQARVFDELAERLKRTPGIQRAGLVTSMPLTWDSSSTTFWPTDRPVEDPARLPSFSNHMVSGDYFQALGIPLVAGRFFEPSDRATQMTTIANVIEESRRASWVGIIDQGLAHRFWPGQNPVGKQFRFALPAVDLPPVTIVGVVGATRQHQPENAPEPQFYLLRRQVPHGPDMTVAMRTLGDPATLVAALRREAAALAADATVHDVRTLGARLDERLGDRRFNTRLILVLAGLALTLAIVGIYGTFSYVVGERTHEIGVRMALGAQAADVRAMILKQSLRLAAFGIACGLLGALGLGQLLAGFLYGVTARDPITLVLVALGVLLLTVAACLGPARRATSVDPLVALRS